MAKTFEQFERFIFGYRNLRLLYKKLEVMIERCTSTTRKRDAVIINEGGEGEGKSNAAVLEAGFVKSLTGRPIHLFFKLKPMMEFAQKTEGKIIIWDEPALDALSTDAMTTLNKDMTRLFMVCRKKRHFFIINFTKFWKFPEYIIVERALGMFRVYSKREVEMGRYLYIKKGNLERLWQDYAKNKKKNYRKYASFHGVFPEIMEDYFDGMDITINGKEHCTIKDYERFKDEAMGEIGHKNNGMTKRELRLWKQVNGFKKRITLIDGINKENLCRMIGVSHARLTEWSKIPPEDTDLLGKPRFSRLQAATLPL